MSIVRDCTHETELIKMNSLKRSSYSVQAIPMGVLRFLKGQKAQPLARCSKVFARSELTNSLQLGCEEISPLRSCCRDDAGHGAYTGRDGRKGRAQPPQRTPVVALALKRGADTTTRSGGQ